MGPFSSANIRRSPRRDEPDGEMHKGTDEGERTIKNEREIKCWGWCVCVCVCTVYRGEMKRNSFGGREMRPIAFRWAICRCEPARAGIDD